MLMTDAVSWSDAVKANIHFDTFEQASWQIYKHMLFQKGQVIVYQLVQRMMDI